MKKSILILLAFLLISGITWAQHQAATPKIISTIPSYGDCNVDPELKEIIIKFDQDMAQGMSLVNSPNNPQSAGQPKWVDSRTFSVPVKLYPGKLYSLAFNSARFQGFTNMAGIALNPDDLYFQTKSIAYELLNKQSYNELIQIFPREYSYATRTGIDWKLLLEKKRAELENAKTNTEFALKLVRLLKASQDPHLLVEVEGQQFPTGRMRLVEANYNSQMLFSMLQEKKVSNGFLSVAGVIDSIGYLSLRDWKTAFNKLSLKPWGDSRNGEIPAEEVLKDLFRYPNLIIDVRENTGGNESYAKEFVSYFAKDSIPYEKVKYFNEKTGAFDKEHIKKLIPGNGNLNYSGNIYVLSGGLVFSSNESFILMMQQLPNAKVVGMKTYGGSGNPIAHVLSNGVKIHIPSWQAYTLDGRLIEGNGIEPDIEIKTTKNDFQQKDVLMEQVVNGIRQKRL